MIKDYVRFLEMALGSSFEVETQILIVKELGFAEEKQLFECFGILEEVQKMIQAFITTIEKTNK